MKPLFHYLVRCTLVAGLAGCAAPGPKSAMLTYESSPEGATLMLGNETLGVAPLTRTYMAGATGGLIRTPDVVAVWPSGARATYWTQLRPGADEVATIERPTNAAGLDKDLANAAKYVAAKDQEARRLKEANLREQARASAKCQKQLKSGQAPAIGDCN